MKSLKRVLVTIIAVTFVLSMAMSTVKALPVTDLKSMKVYSVDTTGKKKKIKIKFNPTTYKYDLVVKSNVARIEIIPKTKDATSTAVVDKEAVNTRMDQGMNTTTVTVTSTGGAKQVYTLKTKKLTPAQDATYKEPKGKDKKKAKKGAKVELKDGTYKIDQNFKKSAIPKGFEKTKISYNGKKYVGIKGKEKDLNAFYLTGGKNDGFYIYEKDQDKFYPMNNVKVKSRMYTIVEPKKPDDILKNYDKKTIKIDGQKVNAWILDEEKGMFFVYAMNWDGLESLYTYDDQEKCLQRYLVDNDVNAQIDAANKAYDNMKAKRNAMVNKYNIFRYIIVGMAIIIVILIFILIHRGLKRKEKKIKDDEFITSNMGDGKNPPEDKKEAKDEDDIDKSADDENDIDKPAYDENDIDKSADDENDIDKPNMGDTVDIGVVQEGIKEAEEKTEAEASEPAELNMQDMDQDEKPEEKAEEAKDDEDTHSKKRAFGRKQIHEGYGDEPTFGTDKESNEGFYGGEVNSENEVLVDLNDEAGPDLADPIENVEHTAEIQDTAEIDVESLSEPEDLKSTLKSMLASEEEEDEDDDFEFIDID